MCPPNSCYRYKPHTMLAEHSRLLNAKCVLAMSYQSRHTAVCHSCFYKLREPPMLKCTLFHGLKDHDSQMPCAPVRKDPCDFCGKGFIIERRALNCPDCSNSYFTMLAEIHRLGYDPQHITRFHYNVIYDYISLLTIRQRIVIDTGFADMTNLNLE